MIENLVHLIPTASTEDLYFYLGLYHGMFEVLNRIAKSDEYFNKAALCEILGVEQPKTAKEEEDF